MDKVNKQELRRLAEACTPETELMHVIAGDEYAGKHAVLVAGNQKMRSIVAQYFGPASDDDWEFGDHGMLLGAIETYDKWLRTNRVMTLPAAILSLLDELDDADDLQRVLNLKTEKIVALNDAVADLSEKLEQYRKDAERYRWLRKQHNDEHSDTGVFDAIGVVLSVDGELDLDAWADTEMAKEGGANG